LDERAHPAGVSSVEPRYLHIHVIHLDQTELLRDGIAADRFFDFATAAHPIGVVIGSADVWFSQDRRPKAGQMLSSDAFRA